jgi:exopolysaccharide biosynthesis polyprenyl glycosylphosphotransferase
MVQHGLSVLGTTEAIPELVRLHRVSEVLVCLDRGDHNALFRAIDIAMRTTAFVKIASPLYRVIPERLFTDAYANIPVVDVTRHGQQWSHRTLKRTLDLALCLAGMLVLAPLFALIAGLIRLESPGPVFYCQTRVGKDGRHFRFFKFRSMLTGSDQDPERVAALREFIRNGGVVEEGETKIVNNTRVTRVGAFLRRTSLDELPQLINVLRGEMSLVGPRPCLPYEYDNYKPWHRKRLSVVPGCTGVWQVNGRSEVGFDDMVILDLYYIQNPSILADLGIIARTIPVMLFGRGGG